MKLIPKLDVRECLFSYKWTSFGFHMTLDSHSPLKLPLQKKLLKVAFAKNTIIGPL